MMGMWSVGSWDVGDVGCWWYAMLVMWDTRDVRCWECGMLGMGLLRMWDFSNFRTRNRVEINDESRGKYNNSNIRFKASLVKSNLCDYSDAYILIKRTITVSNTAAAGTVVNNTNKIVIFKNCASFTDSTTEINNTQVDDAQNVI